MASARPRFARGEVLDWLTISDNAPSVAEDVARIRDHPLVPSSIAVHGYLHDVKTGRLVEVPEATVAGAAS